MSDPSNYYVLRKGRFLREFDLVAKSARSVLDGYFAGESVQVLVLEARLEFESLIPQLPYIGGKQPFTEFILSPEMLAKARLKLDLCPATVKLIQGDAQSLLVDEASFDAVILCQF